jgi:hypothetical protein
MRLAEQILPVYPGCQGLAQLSNQQFLNCGLTPPSQILNLMSIGKELLDRQRAKVGRFKLADFFVPLVG